MRSEGEMVKRKSIMKGNRFHIISILTVFLVSVTVVTPERAMSSATVAKAYVNPYDVVNGVIDGGTGYTSAHAFNENNESNREGWAEADASLLTHTLKARARAEVTGYSAYAQSASVNTYIQDTFTFYIPEGTYNTPLYITLRTGLEGQWYVNDSNSTDDRVFYETELYNQWLHKYETRNVNLHPSEKSTFDEIYDLTIELVEPRYCYDGFSVDVTMTTILNLQMNSDKEISSVEADFYSSARWIYLEAPAGVTWDTESGVAFVPIPSTVWLLGSGWFGLVGFRRKSSDQ